MVDLQKLIEAKLADSLLSLQDPIGVVPITAAELQAARILELRAGFKLPYFNLDGTQSSFFRVRHLEPPVGFAGTIDPKKVRRYSQPAGTLNEAYLPPFIDWQAVANDPSHHVLITEGELKAACATKHGYPCIGLGGVDCFQAAKRGVPLVPPLDQVQWKGRRVTLVYDSDLFTNANVAGAASRFLSVLVGQGAQAEVLVVPVAADGSKQGLDDYMVARGPAAVADLLRLPALDKGSQLLQLGQLQALEQLNETFAYVRKIDGVVVLDKGWVKKPDTFVKAYAATAATKRFVVAANGNQRAEVYDTAREWLGWPGRREVEDITYEPGEGLITASSCYNTWPGWGCQPKERSIQPWHDLVRFIFNQDEKAIHWFQQWAAYPLQRPGAKLATAVVVWGPEHGTGKSLLGYTLGKIYGQNFGEIGSDALLDKDNAWAVNKQFILGDEVTGSDKRADNDRLKSMITRQKLTVNIKFVPKYELPDRCNFYLTSNHPQVVYLEDSDRRYFIVEVLARPLAETFYMQYNHWLETGGHEGLFHYLLNYDLTGFNPQGHAPMTAAKEDLIALGRSEAEDWVHQFFVDPEAKLQGTPYQGRELMLATELFNLWQQSEPLNRALTARKFDALLKRYGGRQRRRVLLKVAASGYVYAYILKGFEKWAVASAAEIDAALAGVAAKVPKF